MNFLKKSQATAAVLLALGLTLGISSSPSAWAAPRSEIAQISVKANGSNFKYWQKESPAFKQLTAFVKDVTNKSSKNYIPVEDRIATFDMDGTIIGETTPFYFEWMLYLDRVYNDPSYQASEEIKERAAIIKDAIAQNAVTKELDVIQTRDKRTILAGLNDEQFSKVVEHAMQQPVPGMTNIKYGEMVYLPIAEVLSYLKANDFTLYIVTGSYRQIARNYVKGVVPVFSGHIIGDDSILKSTNQGDTPPDEYIFNRATDEIITTAYALERNDGEAKAAKIFREIGKKPVLSFGNSSGDASMHEYTQSNKKYKHISFEILCDDTAREYGNLAKAAKVKAMSEKYGWITVSMRDDWKTIYGDKVKKVN